MANPMAIAVMGRNIKRQPRAARPHAVYLSPKPFGRLIICKECCGRFLGPLLSCHFQASQPDTKGFADQTGTVNNLTMTLLNLSDPPQGFIDAPFELYDRLLEEAPLDWQPNGSVLVSRHADLDRIYRDTTRFISDKKPLFGPKFGESPLFEHHTTSLVFNDPPLHLVDSLLENLNGKIDAIEDFAAQIPIHVIGNLFDIPLSERAPLRDWSLAILGALEPVLTPEQQARGNQAVTEFTNYLRDLVARRAQNPGDPETDVLTRLMASEQGQLSEVELLQNCIFILNAGHETTTNLIGNALARLDAHPDQKAALLTNPNLIETAVDEFLRVESPKAGTDLHLCIGAANRDPRQFDEPKEMNLARRPNKHLAFAGGPHTCVGFTLARMEGRIAIGRFLNRFPNFEVTRPGTRSPRLRFRGYEHMPIKL